MFAKRASLLASLLVLTAVHAEAGGPLLIFDPATQTPYRYPVGPVNVYTDSGVCGFLTNGQADNLTSNAMNEWTNVPTAYFTAVMSGKIQLGGVPTDITAANVHLVISDTSDVPNGGGIFVIYDTNGSICSNFFGFPPGVLGVASPELTETGTPNITESWVVVNGAAIDPSDTSPYPGATFGGVFTHEVGHCINVSHTQVNGSALFFADNVGPGGCSPLAGTPDISQIETMYPFIDPTPGSTALYAATVEQLDDVAALSDVYPAAGWPASAGTITGTIFMPDGVTQVTGVNVIARRLSNPNGHAVSALSGDYTQGDLGPDGRFTLHGLTPGSQYLLYVDKIAQGAFSTTPTSIIFLEEYWNGAGESGSVDTDTTCSYVPITVGAGGTAVANILLNIVDGALPLADDDAKKVNLPFGFSFCGNTYTSVWVNSNGNITFGLGDTNPSASGNALLIGAPRICGVWGDLDPTAGGIIAAASQGSNYVIRFLNVPEFYFGGLNTFTITLRPDDSFRVDYGVADALLSTVAGRSPGAGASDPGPTDLSAAPQPLGQSEESVYEEFFLGGDLANLHLEYAPCGTQVGVPDGGLITGRLHSAPNPFKSGTMVSFELPEPGAVKLQVFDIAGRRVSVLVDEALPAGATRYRGMERTRRAWIWRPASISTAWTDRVRAKGKRQFASSSGPALQLSSIFAGSLQGEALSPVCCASLEAKIDRTPIHP